MKLGDKVMDRYSGFKGIAVAQHSYLNGCDRYTVQPPVGEDMKLPDAESFDEMQLVVVEPKEEKRDTDTGGPEKFSDRRRY